MRVRIHIQPRQSRIPAEGLVTDICVRVGVMGDRPVSERILQQIGNHLGPPLASAPCGILQDMPGQPAAPPPQPPATPSVPVR